MTPGSLVTLHWRSIPQVDVYLESDSPSAEEAVIFWNGIIGRSFFAPPIPAIPDILRAFADPLIRANLKGAILVQVDATERDHGETDVRYDKRTGEMINAVITLPGFAHRPVETARHEFGHGLGLDHGPDGTLMGRGLTDGPSPLASYQAKAVKGL